MILDYFHRPFVSCQNALNRGQKVYIYPNDKTSRLEIRSIKEVSIYEVFQKVQSYLQKDVWTARKSFEIKRQITYLDCLLQDGKELFCHYQKKHNTYFYRILRLI